MSSHPFDQAVAWNNAGVRMAENGNLASAQAALQTAVVLVRSIGREAATQNHRPVGLVPQRSPIQHEQSQGSGNLQSPASEDDTAFPFLVKRMFRADSTRSFQERATESSDSDLLVAKVFLNVALVNHVQQFDSADLPGYYHLSSAALSNVPDSDETLGMAVSVLNNFAIWCHFAGDESGRRSCLERLQRLLDEETEFSLDEAMMQGIRCNVDFFDSVHVSSS